MSERYKLAVIGGGAAGLAAALSASKRLGGDNIIIIEKQPRVGRKLLGTGNGRCNISNSDMTAEHYHGDRAIIDSVMSSFSVQNMKRFCSGFGLLLKEDSEGRIYPHSNQASTVLDCIRIQLMNLGVKELCGTSVSGIEHKGTDYIIRTDNGNIISEYVILACGSKASPSLGSDDSGIKLLKGLGIKAAPFFPALCPVETVEKYKPLKGVRSKGSITLLADGKVIKEETGEIQFSDKALSGICVFQCSRYVNEYLLSKTIEGRRTKSVILSVDLMPVLDEEQLCKYLRACRNTFRELPASMILSGALNKKLSEVIAEKAGLAKKSCSALSESDIRTIAGYAKHMEFTPADVSAFASAQVCAGGIGSDEVDPHTLMSKMHGKLFICGEMLNVDGDCGGYNLHFAIGSAILAVKNIK